MDNNQQVTLLKTDLKKVKWLEPIYDFFIKNDNKTIHRDELARSFGSTPKAMFSILKKLKTLGLVTGDNYIKMTERYEEAISIIKN